MVSVDGAEACLGHESRASSSVEEHTRLPTPARVAEVRPVINSYASTRALHVADCQFTPDNVPCPAAQPITRRTNFSVPPATATSSLRWWLALRLQACA